MKIIEGFKMPVCVSLCVFVCVYACVCRCMLSCVRFFATSWTAARQAPLAMGFSRQEYGKWVAISSSRESSGPRD